MAKNLKKYPLKRVLIYKDKKMEITLNAKETQAVIQAGLETTGMGQGLNLININVTQSRKTGNASIILEADSGFGMKEAEEPQEVQQELPLEEPEQTVTEEPKVESKPVQEEVEQPEVKAEEKEEVIELPPEPEAVAEEPQPEAVVEDTAEDTDSLFATGSVEEEPKEEVESDSLFS